MSKTESSADVRYRRKQWLREKYVAENLTQREIGRLCGVTGSTIGRWCREYDLTVRHQQEPWLREIYIDDGVEKTEIAECCGVSTDTIDNWCDEFGLSDEHHEYGVQKLHHSAAWLRRKYITDDLTQAKVSLLTETDQSGISRACSTHGIVKDDPYPAEIASSTPAPSLYYEYDRAHGYAKFSIEECSLRLHQLRALEENSVSEVFSDDTNVHHENHLEIDNRPENISVVPEDEHQLIHHGIDLRIKDEDWLHEQLAVQDRLLEDVADELNCSSQTLQRRSEDYEWF